MRFIVTLPIAVLAGLGAGFAFFRGPAPLSPQAAAAQDAKEERSADAAAWPDSAGATDARAQRLLAAALRKGSPAERDEELYLAIEALSAKDFERLLKDIGRLKAIAEKLQTLDEATGRELASALLARWLKVDPDSIHKWAPRVYGIIPAREERRILFDLLATKCPAEMLGLVPLTKDAAERGDIISQALRELAAQDPAKAHAWLGFCKDPADRRVAEKAFHEGIVQADPLRAIEFAGSLDSRAEAWELLASAARRAAEIGPGVLRQLATSPMPSWMISSLLQEVSAHDPALAVELVLKNATNVDVGRYPLRLAFTSLAQRDPAGAILKLDGLTGVDLATAVSAVGRGWMTNDPAAALAWLAQRPAAEREDPARPALGTNDALQITFAIWARSSPDAARSWADALPAGDMRDGIQRQFARALASRGEAAEATRVLARLGSATDPKVLAGIAVAWTRTDPQAAADWALAQPAGPAQSSAVAGVVGTWANDNPQGVADWLAQFPPGEARDRSVVAFLNRSNARMAGPEAQIAEFDAWFERIEDPWQRAQAAVASYWPRQKGDPNGAHAWLSSLPNVDPELVRRTLEAARK